MPFCPNCGSPFNPDEKFCMQCGNPVDAKRKLVPQAAQNTQPPTRVSALAQQASLRGESLTEVKRMIDYFGPMQSKYNEYESVHQKIDIKSRTAAKALLVWGIIITIFAGSALAVIVHGIIIKSSIADSYTILLTGSITLLGITLIIIYILENKARRNEIERLTFRLAEIAKELTEYYKGYGTCLVGPEYSNPVILDLINDRLRAGRADTIKEAINVLLDDAHKSEMELQAQLTARSARQAAGGATAAAVFSAARFFF